MARVVETPPAAVRALLLAAVAAAACAAATPDVKPAVPATPTQSLVDGMNAARRSHGKPQLPVSGALARAAAAHAGAMARRGFFGHDDPDGTPFWKRIGRYYRLTGYRSWTVGENLYWSPGAPAAVAVVAAWLRSRPHRRDLLAAWQELGVAVLVTRDAPGFFAGQDVTIVVADFGRRSR